MNGKQEEERVNAEGAEFHHGGTESTEGGQGQRDAGGTKDRPDLELERLVMGDEADGVRPSEGWLVREDVVRGVLNLVKGFARAVRVDLDTFDAEQTSVMLEESTFRALADIAYRYAEVRGMVNFAEWKVVLAGLVAKEGTEPYVLTLQRKNGKTPMDLVEEARQQLAEGLDNAGVKVFEAAAAQNRAEKDARQARADLSKSEMEAAELREQVEALTAQLEEEERMVRELRGKLLGSLRDRSEVWALRGKMCTFGGVDFMQCRYVQERMKQGYADGLELAAAAGQAPTGIKPGQRGMDLKAVADRHVRVCGGDALVNGYAQCGCALGDLMPCDHNTCDCVAARRFFCLECEEPTFRGVTEDSDPLPPTCFECGGPTVPWLSGAPVPEKLTTENTDNTEEGGRA